MVVRLRRSLPALAMALACGVMLVSCGARNAETRDPNMVVAAWIAGPPGLNPLVNVSSAAHMIEETIFTPLVDLDNSMLPRWSTSLAKSVDISEGGTRYVLHLRPARWSDGTPLDANDVVFTILLQTNPALINPLASDFTLMKSVRALDARTVEIRLKSPSPSFLPDALSETMPLPKHVLGKYPPLSAEEAQFVNTDGEFAQHPLVSGPFRIRRNVSDAYIILERNPLYWGRPAFLSEVAFRVYPQQDSLYAAVDAGEVDITDIPPSLWRVRSRLRGPHRIVSWPWNVRFGLLMNFADPRVPFFRERAVRKAMFYALNRAFIINGIMSGQADLLNGPLPTFSPYYNPHVPHYGYDPAKARTILDAAGWHMNGGVRMKNGVALRFSLKTGGATDAIASNIAELIQANLRDVGIDCEIDNEELQTFFNDMHASHFEVALRGRIMAAYPDDYSNYDSRQTRARGGNNLGSYDSTEADRWIETARTAATASAARDALNRWQMVGALDPPEIWLYSNRLSAIVPNAMTGFGLTPLSPAALPMDVQFWRRIQTAPSTR